MFKNLNIKKILSSFLSIALLFSCAPSTSASSPQGNKNSFPESVKSVVSSPKFIVPTAIVGAISATAITSHIYNTKFTKPRNPTENNIAGVSDEKVKQEYDLCTYATYSPDAEKPWNAFRYEGTWYENGYPPKRHTDGREVELNFSRVGGKNDEILGAKVEEIIDEMNRRGCKTDFEKAVFLHDYIYDHCKYPNKAVYNAIIGKRDRAEEIDHWHMASGCLVDGKAVCEGIAYAYMILLTRAGVECREVKGDVTLGLHSWNIVKINGQWYHVDVTFDLSYPLPHSRYKWFMLSEEEISKDHNISIMLI